MVSTCSFLKKGRAFGPQVWRLCKVKGFDQGLGLFVYEGLEVYIGFCLGQQKGLGLYS